MTPIRLRRHGAMFQPDSARVLIRPFIPSPAKRVSDIISRALALSDEAVAAELKAMHADFAARHFDIEQPLLANFEKVRGSIRSQRAISRERQLLIGGLFSGEYALESAALFNPSIVPHPDQSGVPAGGLRFVMSLRATGEGHISSIEFRSGLIAPGGAISVEPVSRFVTQCAA